MSIDVDAVVVIAHLRITRTLPKESKEEVGE
jgi:hypothetical protein